METVFHKNKESTMKTFITLMLVFLMAFICFAQDKTEARKKAEELTQNGHDCLVYIKTDGWMNDAVAFYEQAMAADSTYGPAYAYSVIVYSFQNNEEKSRWAVQKADELAPNLSCTYVAKGRVLHVFDKNPEGALESFRTAIKLDPDDSDARREYAFHLLWAGQIDESYKQARKAIELDPKLGAVALLAGIHQYLRQDFDKAITTFQNLNPSIGNWWNRYFQISQVYIAKQEYNKALEVAMKGLELNPDFNWLFNSAGWAYAKKGMYDKALAAYEKSENRSSIGWTYALMGKRDDAMQIIEELSTGENKDNPGTMQSVADIYLALGEKSPALDWMEHAVDKMDQSDIFSLLNHGFWLTVRDDYDPLRSEPRFKAIMDKTGYKYEPKQMSQKH